MTAVPFAASASTRLGDLRLAPDVDAARRLVEEQHVDAVVEQPRELHLLLVAAGERADRLPGARRADGKPRDPLGRAGPVA